MTQPVSQAVCLGDPVTFTVASTGTEPLGYQWRLDGVDIAGQTGTSLTIPSVALGDVGDYTAFVFNSCGSVVSVPATLSIAAAPSVTTDPLTQTGCVGDTVILSVTATGEAPLDYQWRKDGADIVGATSSSLTLVAISLGSAGAYDVVISNACASATSAAATLTVEQAPMVVANPLTQSVCEGAPLTLSVTATGTPLNYQWRKDGVDLAGETAATLSIATIVPGDAGVYDVVVSNTCDSVTSAGATISVDLLPTVDTDPAPQTVCEGDPVTFTVVGSGAIPLSYQWRKGGVTIPGATAASYTIDPVDATDAGNYDVVITNPCGSVASAAAALTVNTPASVTAAPADVTLCENAGSAVFSVVASGTGPLTYQWRKDGVALPGETGTMLTVNPVTVLEAGSYDVEITNICGTITSAAATLTVDTAPSIVTDLFDITACSDSNVTFTIVAGGTAPFTYQWRKDGVDIAGATADSYTIDPTAAADAGVYDVVIMNVCGSITSGPSTLTVTDTITISQQPISQFICDGDPVEFSVLAAGTPPLTYQWRKDGVDIAGATASSFTILAVAAGDVASYDVVVSSSCGTATSVGATLSLADVPAIGTQPTDELVCVGGAVTFTVAATSPIAESYQWRKDGVDLAGETASSLTIDPVALADGGSYDVVVSNACGSTTSSGAALTVLPGPVVSTPPADAEVCDGAPVTLSVVASGTPPLTYQWRKDGADIPGATSIDYTIAAFAAGDVGSYDVVVTDFCTSTTSAAASLILGAIPTITTAPVGAVLCEGDPTTLTVSATGTSPIDFQWRLNGADIPGATGDSYAIAAATAGDGGSYDVVVSNPCGSVTSVAAIVTVEIPPAITAQPTNASVCDGGMVTLSVTSSGTGPFIYQWRYAGLNLPGTNASSLTLDPVGIGNAGNYDVVIMNNCGTVTSNVAVLTVDVAPTIDTDPVGGAVCEGGSIVLSTVASGTGPLSYQWRKGGIDIPGETGTSLTLDPVVLSDAANYDVVVSNLCGASTSATVAVTVDVAPAITTQPIDATVCESGSTSFSVVATGTAPISYQWRKDGVDITGATDATLNLNPVFVATAGVYEVVITNLCGSVTSSAATLTVDTPPTIDSDVFDITACDGSQVVFSVSVSGTGPFTYQWRKDSVDLAGETAASLTIDPASAGDAGSYDVVITNVCGSVTSSAGILTVTDTITISQEPLSQAICDGDPASFSVVAAGTPPLTFQWRKDGVDIPGETLDTLTIASVSPGDAGDYTVQVNSSCGLATSAAATLTVADVPTITVQPSGELACVDDAITFSVSATSAIPVSYQWQKDGVDIAGATASSRTINPVSSGDVGLYRVVITNACGSVTSSEVSLIVLTGPDITVPPVSQDVCDGDNVTIDVTASGTPPLTYQWRKDGVDLPGETGISLTITGFMATDVGAYDVVVTDFCSSQTSAAATLSLGTVPSVVTQPINQTLCAGNVATFTVVPGGTPPFTYQWRRNGVDIPGAISDTLAVGPLSAIDAGTYEVTIDNPCGSVTSSAATLTVDLPPTIDTPPLDTTVCENDIAVLSVSASGASPLTYQWRFNGVDIAGATAATYVIDPVETINAGGYDVVVSNVCGTETSSAATLTVQVNPVITQQPAITASRCEGGIIVLDVVATGSAPITYQWRKDWVDIPGETGAALTLDPIAAADSGDYDVVVTNPCSFVTSDSVTLSVDSDPVVMTAPTSQSVCDGSPATFTVVASGTPAPTFQWRKDGVDIPGAISDTLILPTVSATDAGAYDVVLTNICNIVTSAAATLTIDTAPTIDVAPIDITACDGSNVTFTVSASGTAPLTYQWRKDGVDLAGATSASLVIDPSSAGDAGAYDVVVTNLCGSLTSASASLTVTDTITFSQQPIAQTVCDGDPATFTVVAAGTPPITYQWRKDGVDIAGATAASLTIPAVGASDAADYTVFVNSLCGSATSSIAALTVANPPVITLQPNGELACVDDPVTLTVAATSVLPLSYQWQFGGIDLPGETGASLTFSSLVAGDAGSYRVVVSNACGSVNSNAASLIVLTGPDISVQPASQEVCDGDPVTLLVVASGTPPITYQWRKDGVALGGETSDTLSLAAFAAADAGSYDVVMLGADPRGRAEHHHAAAVADPLRRRHRHLHRGRDRHRAAQLPVEARRGRDPGCGERHADRRPAQRRQRRSVRSHDHQPVRQRRQRDGDVDRRPAAGGDARSDRRRRL